MVSGDVLIAEISTGSSTVTVTAPSGWTLITGTQVANGTGIKSQAYWKAVGGAEPATYRWNFGFTVIASGSMQAYTGVDTVAPIETAVTTATASSLYHAVPSVTPTTDGAKIIGTFAKTGSGSITAPPPGMAWQATMANGSGLSSSVWSNMADRMVATKDPTSLSGTDWWTIQTTPAVGVATAIVLKPATAATTTVRYGYSGGGDTPDITQTSPGGTLIEANYALLGGALITKTASATTWSYPNIHGDTAAVANNSGVKTGTTFRYDPFGNALVAGIPDNVSGTYDYGWLRFPPTWRRTSCLGRHDDPDGRTPLQPDAWKIRHNRPHRSWIE